MKKANIFIRNAYLITVTAICVLMIYPGEGMCRSTGSTAANFLKLGVGSRQVSMGGACAAVTDDVASVFWNPAGLSRLKSQEASFMYNVWFEGVRSSYFGYGYPHMSIGSIGASIHYLGYGEILARDAQDRPLPSVTAHDMVCILSYSKRVMRHQGEDRRKGLDAGINVKYIEQKLVDTKGTAVAADVGLIWEMPWDNIMAGMAVQNVGSRIRFMKDKEALPLAVRVGVGTKQNVFGDPLTVACDIEIPNDNDIAVRFGGEYWVRDLIALRAGYETGKDEGLGLSAGIGLKVNIFQLDYAFVDYGSLGYTHRVGFLTRFGKEGESLIMEKAYRRGMDNYHAGKYAEAILEFNKVLEIDPDNKNAQEMMRRSYEQMR